MEKLSEKMGKETNISFDNLFAIPHLVEIKRKNFSNEEVVFLERSFKSTLDELIKIRKTEGKNIEKQIRRHLNNIRKFMRRMEKLTNNQPVFIRKKLCQRLKELNEENPLSEEKLMEETAYLAQKYDLDEEMGRLKSHLTAYLKLLSAKKKNL